MAHIWHSVYVSYGPNQGFELALPVLHNMGWKCFVFLKCRLTLWDVHNYTHYTESLFCRVRAFVFCTWARVARLCQALTVQLLLKGKSYLGWKRIPVQTSVGWIISLSSSPSQKFETKKTKGESVKFQNALQTFKILETAKYRERIEGSNSVIIIYLATFRYW